MNKIRNKILYCRQSVVKSPKTMFCRPRSSHRELASLGQVFKSCEPVRLTEEDTEYNIFAVKHVFDEHIVIQFNCTNTVSEQVLENVTVATDLADAVRGGCS